MSFFISGLKSTEMSRMTLYETRCQAISHKRLYRDLEERHKAHQEQDYQVDHYERKAPRIEIPHKFLSSGGSIIDVSFALRQVDKPVSNYGAFNEMEKSKECGVYINPFRVVDLSVIPSHILQELESYPILTQIAILSNPEIRKKYFPYWKQ